MTYDLLLALGLAMDAFAVSIVIGALLPAGRRDFALRPALLFGAFQAAMTALGWWLAGVPRFALSETATRVIVLAVLALIGAKMIRDGLRDEPPPERVPTTPELLAMAVATSIDALGAGVSLRLLGRTAIAATATTIGVVTALLSLGGALGGTWLRARLGRRPLIVGGVALIVLGLVPFL